MEDLYGILEITPTTIANAVEESFFSFAKKERIRRKTYTTRELARQDVFDYIEIF